MTSFEIIAAVTTSLGVATFAAIFTILYRSYVKASVKELATGKRDIELMDEYIYSSQESVKIRRRIWGIVKAVLFYGILALLIPVIALSIFAKLNGDVIMLGDRTLMVVASGSMSQRHEANTYLDTEDLSNQFNTFDIILVERVGEGDLKKYDVIAFVDDTGKNVIHRIIGVNSDGSYLTRGDSNNQSDSFHPTHKDIIGRYTDTRIEGIGSFVMFFQSIGGIVTILALAYCLIMLERFNARVTALEEERLAYLRASIDLDLSDEKKDADVFRAEFKETLYYKGFAYYFNETGFIGKDEIKEPSYLEKSDSVAIRVHDENGVLTETELPINFEEGDEKTP